MWGRRLQAPDHGEEMVGRPIPPGPRGGGSAPPLKPSPDDRLPCPLGRYLCQGQAHERACPWQKAEWPAHLQDYLPKARAIERPCLRKGRPLWVLPFRKGSNIHLVLVLGPSLAQNCQLGANPSLKEAYFRLLFRVRICTQSASLK